MLVGVPRVRVADPVNAAETIGAVRHAHHDGATLVAFPELGLSGYSSEDLFQQLLLLDAAVEALAAVASGTADLAPVVIVGLPLLVVT